MFSHTLNEKGKQLTSQCQSKINSHQTAEVVHEARFDGMKLTFALQNLIRSSVGAVEYSL